MRVLRAVSSGEDDEGGGGRIPIVPQSGDDIKAGERCFFLHGPRPFFYPPFPRYRFYVRFGDVKIETRIEARRGEEERGEKYRVIRAIMRLSREYR